MAEEWRENRRGELQIGARFDIRLHTSATQKFQQYLVETFRVISLCPVSRVFDHGQPGIFQA